MLVFSCTDSGRAVKMLWQATDIDPSSTEPYIYLSLDYNLHKDYYKLVEVYSKLVKYRPNELNAYLYLGEAYMSFDPPRPEEALPYFRKAYELDPHFSFAALRLARRSWPTSAIATRLSATSSRRARTTAIRTSLRKQMTRSATSASFDPNPQLHLNFPYTRPWFSAALSRHRTRRYRVSPKLMQKCTLSRNSRIKCF